MSIYSAGTVADVVSSVAYQGSATEAGARWLNAYIDPAHGNCDTIPDEDNIYSTPFKSHFTQSIDRSFFVSPDFTGTIPETFNFTVYLTSFPEWPVAVFGTFYSMNNDTPVIDERMVLLQDPNLYSVINDSDHVASMRMMYKGMTLRYTGNGFDNQGVLTSCQYAFSDDHVVKAVNNTSQEKRYLTGVLPITSSAIAASNKEFYVNRQDLGVYCSNQIMGARSLYSASSSSLEWLLTSMEGYIYLPGGVPKYVHVFSNRFSNTPANTSGLYWQGTNFNFNCTWVVNRFDNVQSAQSVLIEHFGGYQAHVGYNSPYVNFQSFKSYLDPNALATASQLTASLPCIWPSSYNDFKAVWRRIGSFIGSASGQSLISTIAAISGRYGGLISAIGGMFALYVC